MKHFWNKFKGPIIILLCSFVWGTTFVAQKFGSDSVGAFTFTGIRFLISGTVFLIISLLIRMKTHNWKLPPKKAIIISLFIGIVLVIGAGLQQLGINLTKSPSKSAFITSLYIVFVPILGIFFGRKVKIQVVFAIVIAMVGSFLISTNGDLVFVIGDILTLVCAVMYAAQIILIDLIVDDISSFELCTIQFLVTGFLSSILALITKETITLELVTKAMPSILYAALLSGCIGFLFQVVGQKYTEPSVASLLMSFETIFALLGGFIILHEKLSLIQIIGCSLTFIAIIISQLDIKKLFKKKQTIMTTKE